MKFVPKEVSAEIAFHELAYNAVRDALIAASEKGTAIFPSHQPGVFLWQAANSEDRRGGVNSAAFFKAGCRGC